MLYAFLWFWFGDGGINLWLVPVVSSTLIFFFFRYIIPRMPSAYRIPDISCFFLTLSAYLTIWIVVLLHRAAGVPLIIE